VVRQCQTRFSDVQIEDQTNGRQDKGQVLRGETYYNHTITGKLMKWENEENNNLMELIFVRNLLFVAVRSF